MSVFFVLVRKEFGEIIREKRFPIFAIAYTTILGLIGYGIVSFIQSESNKPTGAVVPAALTVVAGLFFFFNLIALVLLAIAFVVEGVAKERDAGMLGLLLTTRARPATVLGAKIVYGLAVYLVCAGFGLLVAAVLGYALGPVVFTALLQFYLGPLLILFVFLLGTGLLLSVVTSSARFALAAGFGVYLPLFLIGGTPLFSAVFAYAPFVKTIVDWSPFAVAVAQMNYLLYGSSLNPLKPAFTILLGVAALALAFARFSRQEVSQ